ncbi:MAG: sigma 54-interacting transcriptional regulator [Deltaproteobacteria bacterium]|nr:sigma 54-interacting transcriptional regulator [Deltaproteobacteria bacterium]MBW2070891.1 sigma 54-interacting transcriptional regulator [Deltaproteobacteria bacterium]
MRPLKLKSKLLLAVSLLVIASGLSISSLVAQRYSRSLLSAVSSQAENLAHAVALESADKILTNDLVALQKMLEYQVRSNPAISYLFIYNKGEVIAHTFPAGVPVDLINIHPAVSGTQPHLLTLKSTSGDEYLDFSWPIFDGNAGILRLGFSEEAYRKQIRRLWVEMSTLTLVILLVALAITLFFLKRFTRPLENLAAATQEIYKGNLAVRVPVSSEDEIGTLASSFNHMVASMESYTQRLEEQTIELAHAHQQTRTFCGIVQEIGGLRSLSEIGSFLFSRFYPNLECNCLELFVFNDARGLLFAFAGDGVRILKSPEVLEAAIAAFQERSETHFSPIKPFEPPLNSVSFEKALTQILVPFPHEKQATGALLIGCQGDCRCHSKEIEVVSLILSQAAGVLRRAVIQEEEMQGLQAKLDSTAEFSGIVGRDPKMQLIYKLIEDVAPTDATVLIQGESGTGKEVVARAIHEQSLRKNNKFVVINSSAYPATLLESELFGHEKGAFTGATRRKAGRFEQAHGGTVFLDEVAEIPPSAQIKLLRVLQTQKFERVGGEKTLSVDVRIIAATNRNLITRVKEGNFREDLYYRLNVIPIFLPPLRERKNDIPLLVRHFLRHFTAEQGKSIQEISPEAMRLFLDYPWPGNVRELENSIEHATVLAKEERIVASDLPVSIQSDSKVATAVKGPILMEHEKKVLREVLDDCRWNKKQAAKRLGISRSTLYEKLKKYQIYRPTPH